MRRRRAHQTRGHGPGRPGGTRIVRPGVALAAVLPVVRTAILWFATWALLFQAIVPTHLIGSAADPLDRLLLASLCHPDTSVASGRAESAPSLADLSGSESDPEKACPQCIFCIPGHSVLMPRPVALPAERAAAPVLLVLRWTPVPESVREHERPAARAPPATA